MDPTIEWYKDGVLYNTGITSAVKYVKLLLFRFASNLGYPRHGDHNHIGTVGKS